MLERFNVYKERFKGKPRRGEDPENRSIELPDGIGEYDNLSQGIVDGTMTINE
jgi:hypothetical protein